MAIIAALRSSFTSLSLSSNSCFGRSLSPWFVPPLRKGINFHRNRAVEKDSEFEVDQDKAREALRKLDEQLQSLSQKQINPPKIRAPDVDVDMNRTRIEKGREKIVVDDFLSESFLGYTAFVLFLFTIFYNILFITVIKPSIDGPDEPVVSDTTSSYTGEASKMSLLQQVPIIPQFHVQL